MYILLKYNHVSNVVALITEGLFCFPFIHQIKVIGFIRDHDIKQSSV